MELTSAALFLNSFFAGYDKALLTVMHALAKAGVVLTPLMKLVTFVGEKGIIFFLLALVCMCFPRTRKLGVCVFGAVCCGALITNIILKDMVARPRPFEAVELYKQWWQAVGAPAEDGFSFPSGHVTAAAAGMTAISLMKGKKWIVPSIVWVLVMMVSRNYLMAHYPSDVLFAALFGVTSGFIAWFITKFIFSFLEDHDDVPLFALALDFDIGNIIPLDGVKEKLGGLTAKLPARGKKAEYDEEYDDYEEDEKYEEPENPVKVARTVHASSAENRRVSEKTEKKPAKKKVSFKAPSVGYKGKHEK